ncbi:uncharacterized protein B4U79_18939 [Dinothrombium tinctorium]|uniref:BHLH domain-containing protein n=1 Tax=Dinothrombium tinctorium TaxID=1965070 RepID=A0A443RM34_9ACAR|nr:uncharacterized protein B4U79_18939 [Dinothrombium tinctorium]
MLPKVPSDCIMKETHQNDEKRATKMSVSKRCLLKSINENSKLKRKSIRNREYEKLRRIVPSISEAQNTSKVDIINEAVKYIDQLHMELVQKLNYISAHERSKLQISLQTQNIDDFHELIARLSQ